MSVSSKSTTIKIFVLDDFRFMSYVFQKSRCVSINTHRRFDFVSGSIFNTWATLYGDDCTVVFPDGDF